MQWAKQKGFTIVELLIVVVVIAILAAITIVAYNGITNRTKDTAVKADIENGVKRLEVVKLQSGTEMYPASLSAANIVASSGNTYYYQYNSLDNSYCLESSNGSLRWYASSSTTSPAVGRCGADGMVGHWNFDGGANDTSGNGLNGTVSGATLTTGQDGSANGAYLFSGAAASITMGNSTLFNKPDLTLSVWARSTNLASVGTLIAKEGKQKYRFNAGGTAVGMLASSTTGWTDTYNCPVSVAVNTWYHVVYTISSSTGRMKLYVNGSQICDVAGPVITGYGTNDVVVGAYNTGGTEGFVGSLDDARFYGRALTGAEIKSLYDQGAE